MAKGPNLWRFDVTMTFSGALAAVTPNPCTWTRYTRIADGTLTQKQTWAQNWMDYGLTQMRAQPGCTITYTMAERNDLDTPPH